jgi:dihydroneopterin aldolase/2-amino-4-hydroxy-6-hydroxymethyldihydropteridine diphosphokinase
MARAYIGIGSNIHPAKNVRAALRRLARRGKILGLSTVYCTEPLGPPGQPVYFNCVTAIETGLSPAEVKRAMLRPIEEELWRVRTQDKYAPRTIDLDLVAYGELTLDEGGIRLPDPDILDRPFLAVPLAELAPDLVLAGRRIGDIAAGMARDGMEPLRDYTWLLRSELGRSMRAKPVTA